MSETAVSGSASKPASKPSAKSADEDLLGPDNPFVIATEQGYFGEVEEDQPINTVEAVTAGL